MIPSEHEVFGSTASAKMDALGELLLHLLYEKHGFDILYGGSDVPRPQWHARLQEFCERIGIPDESWDTEEQLTSLVYAAFSVEIPPRTLTYYAAPDGPAPNDIFNAMRRSKGTIDDAASD